MNILYFTRTMGLGGTEKVILQLCKSLDKKVDKIVVCSCGGCNVKLLDNLGIKHYEIKDIENKNPIRIIETFIKVAKLIKNENINVVHTHHRMAALYTKLLSYFYKFKFIHTAHNTFNDKKKLTNYALNKSEIIAVGENVKKNLTDVYSLNEQNIKVIYNSIEEESIEYKLVKEISECKKNGNFIVGNIGRLSEQKGMLYFVKAAKEVIKKYDKVKFFIVGDGEEKLKIKKMIDEYDLDNYVMLLGYRPDIINIMKQLDIIVLSSLWEGLPLTPIEAFSMGKTVIGTKVDGTPEIIKNNYNGLLVEPKEYSQIADAIVYLYENQEILKKLEKNARTTYEDVFSYNVFVEKYIDFYENIAKEGI